MKRLKLLPILTAQHAMNHLRGGIAPVKPEGDYVIALDGENRPVRSPKEVRGVVIVRFREQHMPLLTDRDAVALLHAALATKGVALVDYIIAGPYSYYSTSENKTYAI